MKKFLLSTALLAMTAGATLAADLPTRKEPLLPPPPPPPMWTGFYAGLNAGYGFGTNSNTQSAGWEQGFLPAGTDTTVAYSTGAGWSLSGVGQQNQNGFIGGGQVGYNYQWGSNIVIGIEADMQGTGIRGSSRTAGVGGGGANFVVVYLDGPLSVSDSVISNGMTSINAGVDWMGTVRGRLGYLFTPTMLIYATGGLTYGGVHANISQFATSSGQSVNETGSFTWTHTFIGGGTKSQTLVGWNVGGGLEWMFMPNWSLKAEGIYWNMGNMNVPTAAFAAAPMPAEVGFPEGTPQTVIGGTRVNYQGVIARMGVNYHFNFGGSAPVIAKY